MLSRMASARVVRGQGLSVFPSAAILLFVLGANLLGDGLRDVLDPLPTK